MEQQNNDFILHNTLSIAATAVATKIVHSNFTEPRVISTTIFEMKAEKRVGK